MSGNPLVAKRGDDVDPWAGIWIAEDIESICSGVKNGSWVDGSLGVLGAGLDGLALVSDPVGVLLQYGVAWIIEHVKPLTEALDWLAGDPAQIAANAQTWRNIAQDLHEQAANVARDVRLDTADWIGVAGDAYRTRSQQQQGALNGLGRAAEAMALVTEGAGLVISTVRVLVRDAVAMCVSRLIVYAAEEAGSLGLATPLVVEQVTTTVAAWAGRISRYLKALLASLRRLLPIIRRLGELIEELKNILRVFREGDGGAPHEPEEPPKTPHRQPPGNLEGRKEVVVNDPANPGRTITDIDEVKDGVLWEDKSAVWAGDNARWVDKQIIKKLDSYLEARQHLPGYENAPIGIRMTEPNVDPSLRSAIETAIDQFRVDHPGVDVRLEFNE